MPKQNTTVDGNVLAKKWFMAGLLPEGTVMRCVTEEPSGLLEMAARGLIVWIDCRAKTDMEEVTSAVAALGFSPGLVSSFMSKPPVNYEDFSTEMGVVLPAVRVAQVEVELHQVIVLLRSNFVLTIHPPAVDHRFNRLRRYADTFLKRIPASGSVQDRLTQVLIRIIDENNDSNFQHLRKIEEQGDDLNAALMNPRIPIEQLGPKIYDIKHALLVYMDALWESVDVINNLRYGDGDLMTDSPDLLDRIGLQSTNVGRQIGLAEHMSDVLASGLEVMQAIHNNQLQMTNNRLTTVVTYLTIIGTALAVPNTLATVFGMGLFGLGEADRGWFLGFLITATVAATGFTFWWFFRRGMLSERKE